MTFSATPQPLNVPPRVRLDVDSDDAGAAFTALSIKRDGALIREQPFVGGPEALAFDYEAPFGVSLTYTAEGSFIPTAVPDWTESWASVAAWTGSGFSASGGKAVSTTNGAQIVRSASGTIQRVDVLSPDYVRVELLDASNVVVCSVAVTSNVVLAGTSSASVTGSGSFALTLSAGTATASAANASWSASRPYTGVPAKVRVVSLYPTYTAGVTWSSVGPSYGVFVDTSGNTFTVDATNSRVRKFNSSGTQTASWSTTGVPTSVWANTSGDVFVADFTNSLVRKYNSSGVAGITWTTTGKPAAVWGNTTGDLFVIDQTNSLVRKYNSSGTQTASWTTTGIGTAIWGDTGGNLFVTEQTNKVVRKFNSSGTQTASWSTTGLPAGIWGSTAGDLYVTDLTNSLVRKYNSSGVQQISFASPSAYGIAGDSSNNLTTTDSASNVVRKFLAKTNASVDDITTTLVTTETAFFATTTTQLDVDEAWLIHPSQPTLSCSIDPGAGKWRDDGINVDIGTKPVLSRRAVATTFNPVGRTRAVVVTHGNRLEGDWTLNLFTPRLEERDAVSAIITDQTPLLFRAPLDWSWDLPDGWYSIGDVDEARSFPGAGLQQPYRNTTLPLTPVDPPIVRQGALWTYGDDLLLNGTYQDSLSEFPTYLDRLAGPVA